MIRTFRPTYGGLKPGEIRKYFFVIVPNLEEGTNLWYYKNGAHWIDTKRIMLECPRIHDGSTCPVCGVLKGPQNPNIRKFVAWERFAIYAYFPKYKNPAEIAGTIRFFNMPITLYRIISDTVTESAWPMLPVGIVRLQIEGKGNFPYYGDSQFKPIDRKLYDKIITDDILNSVSRFPLWKRFKDRNLAELNEWATAISNEISGVSGFSGPTGLTGQPGVVSGSTPPSTAFSDFLKKKPEAKPPKLGKRKLDI